MVAEKGTPIVQTDRARLIAKPRSRRSQRLPDQRWEIALAQPETAAQLAAATGLSPLLTQVMLNRGIETLEAAAAFLQPETQELPLPIDEFPDLEASLGLLEDAIAHQKKIAICGDYDADGMTSTALLLRALRGLGGQVSHDIPSRMQEGYGINERIIEDFHRDGIQLILTVDNGIAALKPIQRAKELGLTVIITDHHDVPPEKPPADAILNPKLIRPDSPYRGLAGVGVAYILAISLAQRLNRTQGLTQPLLELFTLGTIADLAPLTGMNRRWLRRGLRLLPQSELPGVKALIQVAGLNDEQANKALKPEAIGFRLGPRINAVGRIGEPQVVIDLLTADDEGEALERAMQCEQINQRRQQLCAEIEQDAIAWYEASTVDLRQERILVVVQPHWHHGVIGIVASRLVERYGVPVFIGTYEEESPEQIRGSARGIREFNVFEALQFCKDLLGKFGGHRAAGGFSLPTVNLEALRSRLSQFACQCLELEHLKPLVSVDVQANLNDITLDLYQQIDALHPCGIANPDPVFWTPNVRVVEQSTVGQAHLKLLLSQDIRSANQPSNQIKAIAWRWGEYCPLPNRVDVAYRLRENRWRGKSTVELEIVGVRRAAKDRQNQTTAQLESVVPMDSAPINSAPMDSATVPSRRADLIPDTKLAQVDFFHKERCYSCCLCPTSTPARLTIRNDKGEILVVQKGQKIGQLERQNGAIAAVNVTKPSLYALVKAALHALETVQASPNPMADSATIEP